MGTIWSAFWENISKATCETLFLCLALQGSSEGELNVLRQRIKQAKKERC